MSRVEALQIHTHNNAARILLVEDSRVGRLVAERLLRRWGYHVTSTFNGLEALKLTALHSFDMILMNVQMPVLNGWETARLIRRLGTEYQNIPILALSADRLVSKQSTAPFTDFLTVPYMPEQLQHLLQQHLLAAAPAKAHPQLQQRINVLSKKDPLFGKQLISLYIKSLKELKEDLDKGRLDTAAYLKKIRHKYQSSFRLLELYSLEGALDNLQQVVSEQTVNQFLLQQRKITLAQHTESLLEELSLLED